VTADDRSSVDPLSLEPAEEVGCLCRWVADSRRVLVVGTDLADLTAALEQRGHEVLVRASLPVADEETGHRPDAVALGDDALRAAGPRAALRAALLLSASGAVVVSVANAASREARLALLEGTPPAEGGLTRRSLFSLARDEGAEVRAFGRVASAAGSRPPSPDRGAVTSRVAPLLSLDPNSTAHHFVARIEIPRHVDRSAASELEANVLAEEAAAELQIRQIIAVRDADLAALEQVRRDFVSLSRSRMVRWGSMPGRFARLGRRTAGRILRLLRLRH
jgi:hypothetical protein